MIYHKYIDSPLGQMLACSTASGICLLEFTNRKNFDKQLHDLTKKLNDDLVDNSNSHIEQLETELNEYFTNKLTNFTVELDIVGTDFQKLVWGQLLAIPYGETITYQQQAIAMNSPKSVRAVANANGANKISIIIPCHRVIGSSGKLTGYAGGLDRKQWLLAHESKKPHIILK